MNWFLMVQVVVFLIVVLPAIDWGLQEIVKRLFPEWSRGVIASVFGVLIVVGLLSTVPGRTRHLDFVKRMMVDQIAEEDFNGGGTGFASWLGTKVTSLTADLYVQGMRVEPYFGMISIGYFEIESRWTPVTVGFAGIVFRNFFIDLANYEKPQVEVTQEIDGEGEHQLVLNNHGDVKYACAVVSAQNDTDSSLSKFDLEPHASVRIRQEKKGIGGKLKRLLQGDKTLVIIPQPTTSGLCITFRRESRKLKSAKLDQREGKLHVRWEDPE